MFTLKSARFDDSKAALQSWVKWIVRIFALILVLDATLFIIAGRLDWAGAWILSLLYLAFLLVFVIWTVRNAPELLEERGKMAKNVKTWDKILLTLYTVALLSLLIVAALDAGRFRWSEMPVALQAVGVMGLIPCGIWLWWVTRTNAFLSRYARIQDDRGQRVVTTGPYAYVRHPMYAAVIPFVICVVLTLGSLWALIPGGLIGVLFVIRTALEDRMLQSELPGYAEYSRHVRYRLLPGVW
jgi:protein-S-isoprenylcysteine O-methyltransferase Ste14